MRDSVEHCYRCYHHKTASESNFNTVHKVNVLHELLIIFGVQVRKRDVKINVNIQPRSRNTFRTCRKINGTIMKLIQSFACLFFPCACRSPFTLSQWQAANQLGVITSIVHQQFTAKYTPVALRCMVHGSSNIYDCFQYLSISKNGAIGVKSVSSQHNKLDLYLINLISPGVHTFHRKSGAQSEKR